MKENLYDETKLTIRYYEAVRERHGEFCHDTYKFTNTKDINSDVLEIFQEGTPEAIYLTDKDGARLDKINGTMHMTPEGKLKSVDVELENVEEVLNDISLEKLENVMKTFEAYKELDQKNKELLKKTVPDKMKKFISAMDEVIKKENEGK